MSRSIYCTSTCVYSKPFLLNLNLGRLILDTLPSQCKDELQHDLYRTGTCGYWQCTCLYPTSLTMPYLPWLNLINLPVTAMCCLVNLTKVLTIMITLNTQCTAVNARVNGKWQLRFSEMGWLFYNQFFSLIRAVISQPECRSTLGCIELVPGLPPWIRVLNISVLRKRACVNGACKVNITWRNTLKLHSFVKVKKP